MYKIYMQLRSMIFRELRVKNIKYITKKHNTILNDIPYYKQ